MRGVEQIKSNWGLWLYLLLNVIGFGGLVWIDAVYGTLRGAISPLAIALYLLAFVGFVGLLVWGERRPFSMRFVWLAAILFRALMLLTTPTLSDDVYRYMWDGYVATEGVSPYAFAIDSAELDYLDIPQRQLANNTWMASPYMPVAQWIFWGLALLFPLQPFFFQLAMVLFDLGSGVMLGKLLGLGGFPKRRLALYLLNPFVIVEVAHGAHVDAWMIFLMVTAVYFTILPNQHWLLAPLFLALSTMTKIIPVLIVPLLWWRWTWRQRIFYGILNLLLLIPAGVRAGWGLGSVMDGTGLFGALRIYGAQWQFNSALFGYFVSLFEWIGLTRPLMAAKAVSFGFILAVLLVVWLTTRREKSVAGMMRWTAVPLIAYLLLTPTVHPWYTLIVSALIPFFVPLPWERQRWGWWGVAAWLYLNATLIFSYLTYFDPTNFGELIWVRWVEWVPTLGLLATAVILRYHNPPSTETT